MGRQVTDVRVIMLARCKRCPRRVTAGDFRGARGWMKTSGILRTEPWKMEEANEVGKKQEGTRG